MLIDVLIFTAFYASLYKLTFVTTEVHIIMLV